MREHGALSALLAAALLGCSGQDVHSPPAAPAERSCRLDQPGGVELWRCENGEVLRYERATATLTGEGVWVKVRRDWPRLGPTLTMCLGDPLAEPTAGDPLAFRKLLWGPKARWRLELSGQGRCGLSGALELPLEAEDPDPAELVAGGLAWGLGGREAAEAALTESVRREALQIWPQADDAARVLLLRRLATDPHPEAEAALLAIRAQDQVWAAELDRAIAAQAQLSPR